MPQAGHRRARPHEEQVRAAGLYQEAARGRARAPRVRVEAVQLQRRQVEVLICKFAELNYNI